MKLSRKFVSDFIDLDSKLTMQEIADAMTHVGNEYDSCGPVVPCTNLVVGEVVSCVNHPNSDHLHCCEVNIGKETIKVVCGAPNVRVGLKTVVALPGAKLPGGVIEKGKIRGEESNGMLCAKAELGLDSKYLVEKDKTGIHELPDDTKVGMDALEAMGLKDEVIDFELTSNRGDLLSVMGMAYELGAIYHKQVKNVDTSYKSNSEDINNSFHLEIETKDCSLYLAKKAKHVVIKESPLFIQERLIASGIRPINNVVDISNYVMLETGQPLHYYDADRLGDTLIVRNAKDGETLVTLDNQERTLSASDIVISDKSKAVGLAGVMGGLSTEVEETTKNILIESAIFDPVKIRRTSKKILRSEASNRFEKGLDPERTYLAMERSCALLEKYADAEIVGGLVEYNTLEKHANVITLPFSKITSVLGIEIPTSKSQSILEDLGFKVITKEDAFVVEVPSRRLDILIPEDLIEEIGRLYGMDQIPGKLPILPTIKGTYDVTRRSIKHKMADLGLNETMSYTLIPKDKVRLFTKDNFNAIYLNDPMSEDRNTLRYSLLYSLYDIFQYNKARSLTDISIFEMGKSFYQEGNQYKEDNKLAILMSGKYELGVNSKVVDFYTLKGIVEELLAYLGYTYTLKVDDLIPNELHPGMSASIYVDGKYVGVLGKLHPNMGKDHIYVAEINLTKLLAIKTDAMKFEEISKFPGIIKDVAFIVDKDMTHEILKNTILKSGGKLLTKVELFDLYQDILPGKKSMAYKLYFADPTRTLSDEEVMTLFNQIIDVVTKECHAVLRSN